MSRGVAPGTATGPTGADNRAGLRGRDRLGPPAEPAAAPLAAPVQPFLLPERAAPVPARLPPGASAATRVAAASPASLRAPDDLPLEDLLELPAGPRLTTRVVTVHRQRDVWHGLPGGSQVDEQRQHGMGVGAHGEFNLALLGEMAVSRADAG